MRDRVRSVAVLAAGVSLAAAVAWAGEMTGRVDRVEREQRRIVLGDGTELWLTPGLSFDLLAPGKVVRIVYDERDGKKWARSVEATVPR